MFTRALVKTPARSLTRGITTAQFGPPNYDHALRQHAAYIAALQTCGLDVTMLEADDGFPDSTFVEDTAVLMPECAIVTRPGAASRQGEIAAIQAVLPRFYDNIESIQAPGTVDGGDVMMAGTHCYVGRSERTNDEGIRQFLSILERYGYSGSAVKLQAMLHLKTGIAYLEHETVAISEELVDEPSFAKFNKILIPADERYAANCVWINDRVLLPAGFPQAKAAIEAAGYAVLTVDVSEFRKLDGGLSCLSLRF